MTGGQQIEGRQKEPRLRCSRAQLHFKGQHHMGLDSSAPGDGRGCPAAEALDMSLNLDQLGKFPGRGEARADRQDHYSGSKSVLPRPRSVDSSLQSREKAEEIRVGRGWYLPGGEVVWRGH